MSFLLAESLRDALSFDASFSLLFCIEKIPGMINIPSVAAYLYFSETNDVRQSVLVSKQEHDSVLNR